MRDRAMLARAHAIRDEQEAHIKNTMADVLIDECIERLLPILTHERPASTMSVPVDHQRDDDVFVIERLREVRRRLRLETASEGRIPTAGPQDDCGACYECLKDKTNELGIDIPSTRMILCPVCGNKRCPMATWHWNACTGSNEPGQPGSRYPAVDLSGREE